MLEYQTDIDHLRVIVGLLRYLGRPNIPKPEEFKLTKDRGTIDHFRISLPHYENPKPTFDKIDEIPDELIHELLGLELKAVIVGYFYKAGDGAEHEDGGFIVGQSIYDLEQKIWL